MLELFFSSNLDWSSYIVSIAEIAAKSAGTLTRSIKFLSPEPALYLYKSTIRSGTEYCCHVWAGVPSSYFDMSDKLQKWMCRTIAPTLATSLEPLGHLRNVASLSFLL